MCPMQKNKNAWGFFMINCYYKRYDFEIKKFITANRAEVKDMCLTEYNEAEAMEMLKEEGRQEGLLETMILNIHNLMDSMGCTAEKAMDLLKIPQAQRIALYLNLSKK